MTQDHPEACLLQVRGISKSFPGVQALRDVSLEVRRGEVLAVLGENGAGKSTLMKILAGVQGQDSGEMLVEGEVVQFSSTRDAMEHGVVLIHQELNLSDNLDVGSNIFLGREPGRNGWIDQRRIERESQQYLQRVGLDISPRVVVDTLTIGHQQLVEIAKALSVDAKILIMDEPTSSLSNRECEALFAVVDDLRDRGVSIIYISHRLGEITRLADRVAVLRDGENAGELEGDAITHDAMVRLMVGRDVSQRYSRQTSSTQPETLLSVNGLVTPHWPGQEVSFQLGRGEILGIAGLVGAGRTELLQSLFGVDRRLAGEIEVDGVPVEIECTSDAIAAGMALVPEDRKQHGLVLGMSVCENVGLAGLLKNAFVAGGYNQQQEKMDSLAAIESMRIRTPSDRQHVQFLSGGNQQKVVIGKWMALAPKVLLLDEPTRGIDIGAKEEIYRLMEQLAEDGMGIVFVSSEMEEILGLSDRALVMHEGRLSGELQRTELSEESVMTLATGGAV
ncbi:MAG: sugar ABC transporter ATP-binding protein [Aureliella sp.]